MPPRRDSSCMSAWGRSGPAACRIGTGRGKVQTWDDPHESGSFRVNDGFDVTAFDPDQPPVFVRVESAHLSIDRPPHLIERVVSGILDRPPVLSQRENLAIRLFHSSFFHPSPEARLLMLVMAIESLLEPMERSDAANQHVGSLIESTRMASLPPRERDSLIGSLEYMRNESISTAGRRLAEEDWPGVYMMK